MPMPRPEKRFELSASQSTVEVMPKVPASRKGGALWWVLGITGLTAAAVAIYRRTRTPVEDPWATPAYPPVGAAEEAGLGEAAGAGR